MQYFDAYLMLAEVDPRDQAKLPPGLRVLAIRTPPPPDKPETGIIFLGQTDQNAMCRILEALWLDRRFVTHASSERKLFLLGDDVYLQVGTGSKIAKVGEAGPIKGAVEGFRDQLQLHLEQLEITEPAAVASPLGTREVRYLEVRLPDPGAVAEA